MAADAPAGEAIWALVPAAGSGTRLPGDRPKQYLDLGGRSVLERSLDCLLAHEAITGAMLVLAADDTRWDALGYRAARPLRCAVGGRERHLSVLNGLRALRGQCGDDTLVLVHDAARPLLRRRDLDRLIAACRAHADGAILATPVTDTLHRQGRDGVIDSTVERAGLWRALTPQGFRLGLLLEALEKIGETGAAVTDEAQAVGLLGRAPRLVEGSADNIKITTAADLALARVLWSDHRDQQDHE